MKIDIKDGSGKKIFNERNEQVRLRMSTNYRPPRKKEKHKGRCIVI